ncbi:NAD-dependent epimerase/dehydratase family protein [Roseovarius sp. D22-M7]|uniref:NAD-dependent epimerase/dehydratase family protein n=1 Tax=Roseovarius sp. D22-M7 TaxID=3127116 RepID=UPI00301053BA
MNTGSVLILGGDGFCGWPTALRFSSLGAAVTVLDNGARRSIDAALGTRSLVPIRSLHDRVETWADVSDRRITHRHVDLAEDYPAVTELLRATQFDTVLHFAEQRSAPYSMLSSGGARYSVDNNIRATHNLLAALVETGSDAHLIHMGSIGVYGYATVDLLLPEGYVSVRAKGADQREIEREILYPGQPESIYHMTKMLDQHLFAFYAHHYGIRITDLHQGVVWGTQTAETRRDPGLTNRFDHDPVFGTVVNRFMMQAIEGKPLSVYGSGRQSRAFIHIEDMLTCLTLAADTAPARGEKVRILNQFSEVCSIAHLAARVSRLTGAPISHVDNPRQEPAENDLDVDRATYRALGVEPRRFTDLLGAELAALPGLLGIPDPPCAPGLEGSPGDTVARRASGASR